MRERLWSVCRTLRCPFANSRHSSNAAYSLRRGTSVLLCTLWHFDLTFSLHAWSSSIEAAVPQEELCNCAKVNSFSRAPAVTSPVDSEATGRCATRAGANDPVSSRFLSFDSRKERLGDALNQGPMHSNKPKKPGHSEECDTAVSWPVTGL